MASNTVARIASALALLVGALVFLAWMGDSFLRAVVPGVFTMKVNSAVGFCLLGVALWQVQASPAGRVPRLARGCALAVALLASITLVEYGLGRDLGIDQALARDPSSPDDASPPGQMPPPTALNFLLLGLAILLHDVELRRWRPSHPVAYVAIFIAGVGLVGHLYGVPRLDVFGPTSWMALPTALLFLALGVGLLTTRPERGLVATLLGRRAGSVMARRVLPLLVVLPAALGALVLAGQRAGAFEADMGAALRTVTAISLFVAVVWWNARLLDREDVKRWEAERALGVSERRYRQALEAALDAVIVADGAGTITLCNRAAERMFGRTAAELVGQPLTVIMPPALRETYQKGLERYMETRELHAVGRVVDLRGWRKDGTEFPVEVSLSSLDVDGEVQFLGIVRDTTERARMRAALAQNEKLASLGLLSAGIAHEINNPMAYVSNNLHVLGRDLKGLLAIFDVYEANCARLAQVAPEAAERVRALSDAIDLPYVRGVIEPTFARTREGARRVTAIVDSLRGMVRTDQRQPVAADLSEMVHAGLELIRTRLERRAIKVELDCAAAPTVRCIPTLMIQVFLNLLTNAMHAIESAGRTEGGLIRVVSRHEREECVVEVTDNGCGIPAENLARLFDPFFTTKPVGEGTGLGLSVTHSILAGHGGRIEVESSPGVGTCFRLHLPR